MYSKFKELARKKKFFRSLFITMIAVAVFCRLVKRYYINGKEKRKLEGKSGVPFKALFRNWKIESYACAALVVTLLFGTVMDGYASDMIDAIENKKKSLMDEIENKKKPLKEVAFQYTRGIGKQLFDGSLYMEEAPIEEYPKMARSENGAFRLDVIAEGFEGILREGREDVIYPLVIRNSGSDTLTDIRIDTQGMRLSGYDERLSALIQKAFEAEKSTETLELADIFCEKEELGIAKTNALRKIAKLEIEIAGTEEKAEIAELWVAEQKEETEIAGPELAETEEETELVETDLAKTEEETETAGSDLAETEEETELAESELAETEEETELAETEMAGTEDETEIVDTEMTVPEEEASEIAEAEAENDDAKEESESIEQEEASEITDIQEEASSEEAEEVSEVVNAGEEPERAEIEEDDFAWQEQEEYESELNADVQETMPLDGNEEIVEISDLQELRFSLCPGEEVVLYLELPEGFSYGTYTDQIQVMAAELSQPCSIDVEEKIYANEGEPWKTMPDETDPVISFDERVLLNTVDFSDGFDFQVWEKAESDSGICRVECYLNGNLVELEPEVLEVSQRDAGEVVLGEACHVDFEEPGIQSLSVLAVDQEGNQSVCEMEIPVIREESYHITMPDKIYLAVDPDMAYGDSQVYNMEDFVIKNDSEQDVLVSVEEMLVNVRNAYSELAGEKKCSLNMSVIVDEENVCSIPIEEAKGQDICQFWLKGKEKDEQPHQAYLVFKGSLEGQDKADWHEGDIEIQYQIKFSAVE